MENAYFAGVEETARRPVTCEHSWFNGCITQLTALMPGRMLLLRFYI